MFNTEPCLEVTEFLYVEPDTGMVSVMIADENGLRPAMANEISGDILSHLETFGYQSNQVVLNSKAGDTSLVEWAHAQVDAFCAEFVHAFCLDQPEVEGWDEVDPSPAPSPC